MAVTKDDIKTRFPEFASYSDAKLDAAIADAELQVNRNIFGAKADLAVIYMAAHSLAVSNVQQSGGAIQSQKVGDLSITYAGAGAGQGILSTGYGNLYFNLRKQVVGPIVL